jgi:hypothetical protein
MNESEFEQQLRGIKPAGPRRIVEERIAAELAPAPASGTLPLPARSWLNRLLPGLGWSALGAAAGIIAILGFDLNRETAAAPKTLGTPGEITAAAQPDVELEQELLDVADAGIVDAEADGLARVVRYESLERRRWTDQDGAVTVVELPREDLVFVPVSFQ